MMAAWPRQSSWPTRRSVRAPMPSSSSRSTRPPCCAGTRPSPVYQVRTTGAGESQYEMLEKLQLSAEAERTIADHCRAIGITFMSTPYDEGAVERLDELGVPAIKIASCDITHGPLLLSAARTGLPIILSTGAATLDEVRQAVDFLAQAGCEDVIVLQCTTSYPAPPADINLAAMAALAGLGRLVGFSDHSTGTSLAVAARALGATVIEKHFTLDPSAPGPDHAASLEPAAARACSLTPSGKSKRRSATGSRTFRDIERDARALMRRSIVAARPPHRRHDADRGRSRLQAPRHRHVADGVA